ncbi:C-GCAxxG-C-C family protein, partial [Roseburia hominis]
MTKQEKAIELHDRGCNCAQAVACAFAEEIGVPEETLFAAAEGFGLGMGGMEATCGA